MQTDFKALRLAAGLSQTRVAEMIGCNQTTVGRIERGAETSPALLRAMEEALSGKGAAPRPEAFKEHSEPYVASAAVEALHERIRLLEEISASRLQTIEAQRETIAAQATIIADLQQAVGRMRTVTEPPASIARDGGKRQPA